MKTKTVYKATIYGSSTNSHPNIFYFWLHYHIGEKTIPKIGKIFCFETEIQAKDFVYTYYRTACWSILEGIGANPTKIKYVAARIVDIKRFWERKISKKRIDVEVVKSKTGTVLVDSFIPISVILQNRT